MEMSVLIVNIRLGFVLRFFIALTRTPIGKRILLCMFKITKIQRIQFKTLQLSSSTVIFENDLQKFVYLIH